MGKDLKGKELGVGITQQKNVLYSARFVDKFGKRRQKRFKKLQECRQWIADATYVDEHSNILQATDIVVDSWFDYWIDIKKKTVRPNTVRNYTERYNRNIKKIIGKMLLSEVKPLHCQKIFSDMADEDYRTSTIYQIRIALFNMLEFAKENDVIRYNPCKKSVKSDMGKPSQKKEALTVDIQKVFLEYARGQSYEYRKNSTYDTALFKICDKAQIPRFSMHVLRHTFATRCIEGGMKPKTLQIILGHSNIGITMNLYVHTTEEEKLKEIELVADALNVV